MSTTINLTTSPVSVPLLTGNQLMIVEHTGGNMVYYRSTSNVGPQTNDGVLTLGQTTQFYSGPVWFASDSTAQIIVTYISSPITPASVVTVIPPSSTVLPLIYAPAPTGGDDAAALQALVATGRTVQLQSGVYNIASTLNCDGLVGFALRGAAGEWNTNAGTVISYSGAGTAISLRGTGGSSDGCVISNLVVRSNTAAILVDFGTSSGTATAAGTSNCKVEKVYFDSTSTTNILLNFAQAISCHVDDCAFVGGGVAVQGVTTTNGFSNTQTIECSYFKNQTTIAIKNPGQNWSVIGNTFEPLLSGAAGAILHDGTVQSNRSIAGSEVLRLMGNSFQDATGGTWCTLRGEGLCIEGNMFDSAAANHVLFAAGVVGVTIMGNTFAGATTAAINNAAGATGTTDFVDIGNRFSGNAADISVNPGARSIYTTGVGVGFNLFGLLALQTGSLDIKVAGQGLQVAEGSNAKQGVATLSAGAVVVSNTSVTASSRILLTSNTDGGTPGWLRVSARSAGTSFTITSSSATDTSVIAYEIFEPG